MKKVITISREFGSGGREIGFRLAEKLRIPFYDKEIISMAAEDSNIAEEVFHAHDEVIHQQERVDHEYQSVDPFSVLYEIPVQDQLFMAQSQIIRRLEQAGPCVIIGRCSDFIVEDGFHVFICGSMKKRVERMQSLKEESARKLEARIREIDQRRRDYYQYYSGNEWGNPRNYHLSINSSKLGIGRSVEMILACLNVEEMQDGKEAEPRSKSRPRRPYLWRESGTISFPGPLLLWGSNKRQNDVVSGPLLPGDPAYQSVFPMDWYVLSYLYFPPVTIYWYALLRVTCSSSKRTHTFLTEALFYRRSF